MQISIKHFVIVIGYVALFSISSCRKLAEVQSPISSTSSNLVFSSDATAAAVLTEIYASFNRFALDDFSSPGSISLYAGLSADEFMPLPGVTGTLFSYYTNTLTEVITSSTSYWESLYPRIFVTNAAIEGISAAMTLTPSIKKQLLGEAKFMRAFFYFYLVNFYGDVPLILTTDYTVNASMSRSPKAQVWAQIITDLQDAQSLLSSNYLKADIYGTTSERVRPTKWAAAALLSRALLYQKKWDEAEKAATIVLSNTALFDTVSLSNKVFSKISKEAIWQLQPINAGWNTEDAKLFIIPATGPGFLNYVELSNLLLNSFEPNDNRKTLWVNNVTVSGTTYHYPYKYTSATANASVTEYQMVLRLAEQYLIRAESRANQGNIAGALADLNVIRKRAKLSDYSGLTDQSSLLSAILHERHVELFSEWGHRWFDLKRTGKVEEIMNVVTPQKGGTWNTNWQWYPIMQEQLQKNPFLKQNEGYK